MSKFNKDSEINNALRQAYRKYPILSQCLNEAKSHTEFGVRGGAMFICNHCGLTFKRTDVQVDHIDPVIPINKSIHTMSWDLIISRLFCSLDNLQVLCKPCHQIKCNRESEARADHRRALLMA